MDTKHVTDELSAYIDGEARDAARIDAHLAHCAECARRYEELSKLSEQIRALPVPEIRPEFVTRVMAGLREADAPRSWWMRLRAPLAVSCAAAIALLIAAAYLRGTVPPRPVAPSQARGPAVSSEDTLASQLERRLATNPDALATVLLGEGGLEGDEEVSSDDLLAALPDSDWFRSLAGAVEEDEDWYALVETLNASELEILKGLIREYEKEG